MYYHYSLYQYHWANLSVTLFAPYPFMSANTMIDYNNPSRQTPHTLHLDSLPICYHAAHINHIHCHSVNVVFIENLLQILFLIHIHCHSVVLIENLLQILFIVFLFHPTYKSHYINICQYINCISH